MKDINNFLVHYITGIVVYLEHFTELKYPAQISLIGLEKQSLLCPLVMKKWHNFQDFRPLQ